MTKKDKDQKSAKAAPEWDGEADPVTEHGGDWFWGGTYPPVEARDARAVPKDQKKA
jgi:hypothetical protein